MNSSYLIIVTIMYILSLILIFWISKYSANKRIQRYTIENINKKSENSENSELNDYDYNCFICKEKFVSSDKITESHPLCSLNCAEKYVEAGFQYE